ncbi:MULTISPECIES: DUF4167 domain-containing protein [unclassified Rhizobium]|uniref:DUF4167 domain-containing protein n=1 Tax=unclassified Rhizobium TaxID=2613769 RepID=UPI0006FD2506|nr:MULTISPECIES: DUF4167 domain-containing protein [unclassified Rhizobium]KQV39129.1 hypothetical protein ASC86_22925 [Rhizobium sp. Root1212]KRD35103.1 hypothetical protein ASE37_21495 [Rhizobium sp. Root268]
MRPGQQNKRGRGRNNNNNNNGGGGGGGNNNNHNRKGQNPLTRTYDSSGPDVKIRGTAQHIAEKYMNLARDAQSSGDRVMAENYLQHAEHYNRIIAAAQAQMQERFQRDDRNSFDERDNSDRDTNDQDDQDQGYTEEAPAVVQPVQPAPQPKVRQQQPQPQAQPQPQPVVDGSGPQPVIEGVPAEVALEEEAAAPAGRAPTRRRSAPRPRRQPRRGEANAEEGAAPEGGEAPAMAEVSE